MILLPFSAVLTTALALESAENGTLLSKPKDLILLRDGLPSPLKTMQERKKKLKRVDVNCYITKPGDYTLEEGNYETTVDICFTCAIAIPGKRITHYNNVTGA